MTEPSIHKSALVTKEKDPLTPVQVSQRRRKKTALNLLNIIRV
jgi:hypothetical protein